MGTADLVPGVSGGTMALILGIYEELLHSLRGLTQKSLWRHLVRLELRHVFRQSNGAFLLVVGAGILTALLVLSRPIEFLLHAYPVYVWSFFFGLVLSSVALMMGRVDEWKPALWLIATATAVLTYFLIGLAPISTPSHWWLLLLSGALGACAMILPGISGSYVLILLGQYHFILAALNHRDLDVLALVVVGAVAGLLMFARGLSILFRRHPDTLIAVMAGFLLGSLRRIWPWQRETSIALGDGQTGVTFRNHLPPLMEGGTLSAEVLSAAAFLVAGMVIVAGLGRLAHRRGPSASSQT